MLKETGRLTPADEKEMASLKGKDFICMSCGYRETRLHTEFGDVKCPKCLKDRMVETIHPEVPL